MTPTQDPSPATQPAIDPAFEPEAVRLVADVETLRAISDPTRVRLLETMVSRTDRPWSVRELAAALGLPQTRLYHHMELLIARDLVRAVEQRVVSGIIETRYRVAARSFQLDRRLFAGDGSDGDQTRQALHDTLLAIFDSARDEVEAAIRIGAADAPAPVNPAATSAGMPPHRRLLLSRGLARLSPDRAAELRRRLEALETEFEHDDAPHGEPYGLLLAVYPLPPTPEPNDA
jgi:DNA-binding transcriptional ArsR family regulator